MGVGKSVRVGGFQTSTAPGLRCRTHRRDLEVGHRGEGDDLGIGEHRGTVSHPVAPVASCPTPLGAAARPQCDRTPRVVAYADMEGAIETERLRLSPLTAADLDDLVELDGDPEVRRVVDPLGIIIPIEPGERCTNEREWFAPPGGFYGARDGSAMRSSAGFSSRASRTVRTRPSSAIASAGTRGAWATPPRARSRSSRTPRRPRLPPRVRPRAERQSRLDPRAREGRPAARGRLELSRHARRGVRDRAPGGRRRLAPARRRGLRACARRGGPAASARGRREPLASWARFPCSRHVGATEAPAPAAGARRVSPSGDAFSRDRAPAAHHTRRLRRRDRPVRAPARGGAPERAAVAARPRAPRRLTGPRPPTRPGVASAEVGARRLAEASASAEGPAPTGLGVTVAARGGVSAGGCAGRGARRSAAPAPGRPDAHQCRAPRAGAAVGRERRATSGVRQGCGSGRRRPGGASATAR